MQPAPHMPPQPTSHESSQALAPLQLLQALGLSHNMLDSWPAAVEQLPQLMVLYLGEGRAQ